MRRQARVSDGVDTAVKMMQTPGSGGTADGALGVAKLAQLRPGHNAVLSIRCGRQLMMRAQFCSHTDHKCERRAFSPPNGAKNSVPCAVSSA
jgi:hypothetical protein